MLSGLGKIFCRLHIGFFLVFHNLHEMSNPNKKNIIKLSSVELAKRVLNDKIVFLVSQYTAISLSAGDFFKIILPVLLGCNMVVYLTEF